MWFSRGFTFETLMSTFITCYHFFIRIYFLDPVFIFLWGINMILRLRARPKYQLSSGTKVPCESALYLARLGFLSSSTIYCNAQPWWATLNHSQSGYAKTGPKTACFGHLTKCQWVKFATKYLKFTTRQYLIWFPCFSYWKKKQFLQYFLV